MTPTKQSLAVGNGERALLLLAAQLLEEASGYIMVGDKKYALRFARHASDIRFTLGLKDDPELNIAAFMEAE